MKHAKLAEKYIQKKATASELEEINKLLDEDAEFKQELSFLLELQEAIKREEHHKLKQQLQHLEHKPKTIKLIPNAWKYVAVFVFGLGLLWYFNRPHNYDRIFEENFVPFPNIEAPSVRDSNIHENDLKRAFSLYDNRAYEQAASAFRALSANEQMSFTNFYLAVSLLADNQIEAAIEVLENPDWNVPDKYQNQTDWYLARAYLKMHEKEKALVYLNKLAKSETALSAKAKNLLDLIN
jgi:predicted Zn-dependent protease